MIRVRTEGSYEVWETPTGEYLVVSPFGQAVCPTMERAVQEMDARNAVIRVVATSAHRLAASEHAGHVPGVMVRRN